MTGRAGGPTPTDALSTQRSGTVNVSPSALPPGRSEVVPQQGVVPLFDLKTEAMTVARAFTPFTPACSRWTLAENKHGGKTHFPLVDSRCLLNTFASLIGDQKILTMDAITKVIQTRQETVFKAGWHSVKQANAALTDVKSTFTISKAKSIPRILNFNDNPFLRTQNAGLWLIQARTRSTRSRYQIIRHIIGVDFDSGTFVDTLIKTRRPINKHEWELIGVIDWQQTFVICTR